MKKLILIIVLLLLPAMAWSGDEKNLHFPDREPILLNECPEDWKKGARDEVGIWCFPPPIEIGGLAKVEPCMMEFTRKELDGRESKVCLDLVNLPNGAIRFQITTTPLPQILQFEDGQKDRY